MENFRISFFLLKGLKKKSQLHKAVSVVMKGIEKRRVLCKSTGWLLWELMSCLWEGISVVCMG